MFRATKEFELAYAHRIVGHQGKCGTLHGHNGRVLVAVEAATLDGLGMAVDFDRIKKAVGPLIELWDHKRLLEAGDPLCSVLARAGQRVEALGCKPTAEGLAQAVAQEARRKGLEVAEVVFWESDSCCGTWRAG